MMEEAGQAQVSGMLTAVRVLESFLLLVMMTVILQVPTHRVAGIVVVPPAAYPAPLDSNDTGNCSAVLESLPSFSLTVLTYPPPLSSTTTEYESLSLTLPAASSPSIEAVTHPSFSFTNSTQPSSPLVTATRYSSYYSMHLYSSSSSTSPPLVPTHVKPSAHRNKSDAVLDAGEKGVQSQPNTTMSTPSVVPHPSPQPTSSLLSPFLSLFLTPPSPTLTKKSYSIAHPSPLSLPSINTTTLPISTTIPRSPLQSTAKTPLSKGTLSKPFLPKSTVALPVLQDEPQDTSQVSPQHSTQDASLLTLLKLEEKLRKVLETRLPFVLTQEMVRLSKKNYRERLVFVNHEFVDKILQTSPAPPPVEGQCLLSYVKNRFTDLERLLSLLLMTLPRSLQEIQEAGHDIELTNYLFRPEKNNILDVNWCRDCHQRDHRGYCRQVLFCKSGTSVSSQTPTELLELLNG